MSDPAIGTYRPPQYATRPLTPERVRSVEFSRTPIGRRGLDPDEVYRFVERMAEEIARRDALEATERANSERYRDALKNWQEEQIRLRGGSVEAQPRNRRPDADTINLLSRAQQEADSLLAQTRVHCRQLAVDAQEHADGMMEDARLRAEEAAKRAAHDYRTGAGGDYSADLEELERRLAWVRAFTESLRSAETQISATREALELEVGRVVDIARARERL